MNKKLAFTFCLILFSLINLRSASAQVGFNPEYLGNANAPSRTGFALKTFQSYYYQEDLTASDVETDFETQFYTKAFTGDIKKDMFQWALHLPIGYRYQKDANGQGRSVTGIGTLNAIIEYYYNIIDDGETVLWFDNGIVVGFPTATSNGGMNIQSNLAPMRIGADNYSITWFQENYFYHKPIMLTINPFSVSWSFRDDVTKQRGGLGLSLMNGSVGYEVNKKVFLGIDFGVVLGNVLGSDDGTGTAIPRSVRGYMGPAALVAFTDNTSLQVCGVIDFPTKNTTRGQGLFVVLFHHF